MAHYDIAPTPNTTIGCQELVKSGACVHSGWLRRQSIRNKLKIFAWAQVYVAVSGGCVYCYSNEVSKKPASAFSLYGYDKVFRAGEITSKEATWVFKLVHANSEFRSYLFSSSSEKEMHVWMMILKQEMLRASGKLPRQQGDGGASDTYQDAGSRSDGSLTSQDYMEIETNIYEDNRAFVLPTNYNNKKEDEDSGDEMDSVVKRTLRDPRDRPPQPPPVPDRTTKMLFKSSSSASLPTIDSSTSPPPTVKKGAVKSTPDSLTNSPSTVKGAVKSTPDSLTNSPSTVKGAVKSKTPLAGIQEAAIIAGLQKQKGAPNTDKSSTLPTRKVKQEDATSPTSSDSSHEWQRGTPDGSSVKKKENKTQEYDEEDVDDFWSTIYFYDDKEKASQIINLLQDDGVYLVRVNPDKSMVLHVYGGGQSRKFQIFHENKQYTLQKTSGNFFKTVPELVYFYYTNTLPSVQVCLTECYVHHPGYPHIMLP